MKRLLLAMILSSVAYSYAAADNVYGVPFVEDFTTNSKRSEFTTIDANGDGVTFSYHYRQSILPGWYPDTDYHEMEYESGHASQTADDWFITPKIHLEVGKVYSFSFNASSSFDGYAQKVEVSMGQGVTVGDMTMPVMKAFTINSSSKHVYEQEFVVSEEGDYNVGIHVMTEPDHAALYFTDITVKQASSDSSPAKVTDLQVVPDSTGLLMAEVLFTAPSATISGEQLENLTKIEISRNDRVIKTLTDVAPGSKVSYVDKGAGNGFNSYMVICYNESGKGIRAKLDSVYVGVDVPLPPTGLTLTDMGSYVRISWDAVSNRGRRGFVVNPNSVTYQVDALNSSYEWSSTLTETSKTYFNYSFNSNKGEQDLQRFGVLAENVAGWSSYAVARMVVGAPYNLPYRESFATGTSHGLMWQEGDGTFFVETEGTADADAGCVVFDPQYDGQNVSFNLGKMNMKQALHPVLRFSYKGLSANDSIVASVVRQDGTVEKMAVISGETPEWTTTTLDLSAVAGDGYVIPKFFTTGTKNMPISLDDFFITDVYDCDLAVDVNAVMSEDNKAEVDVVVTNEGMTVAADYDVLVSVDNIPATRIHVSDSLAPGHYTVHHAQFPVDGADAGSVEVKAEILYLYDLNPYNDVASVQVETNRSALDTPDASAIKGVRENACEEDKRVYTLDGRKVAANAGTLSNGIYIKGGRKVCVTK